MARWDYLSIPVFRPYLACLSLGLVHVLAPSPALSQCTDNDGDGFSVESGCGATLDCNDAAPTTYPGAPEVCDGFDNDRAVTADASRAMCPRTELEGVELW